MASAPLQAAAVVDDAAVRRALADEMSRASKELGGGQAPRPHHISYQLYDVERAIAVAEQGAMVSALTRRYRALRVSIRVGDRRFDSAGFATGFGESGFMVGEAPSDDLYPALRAALAATGERAYTRARKSFAEKQSATRGEARRPEDAPFDFADAEPASTVVTGPGARAPIDLAALTRLCQALSALPGGLPEVESAEARGQQLVVRRRLLTSDGAWVDERRSFVQLRVTAGAQALDGMPVGSEVAFTATDLRGLPALPALNRAVRAIAAEVPPLRAAPVVPAGKAIVLFEAPAAGPLLEQLVTGELSGTPPPLLPKGKKPWGNPPFLPGQLGKSVAPAFLAMHDDPRAELGPGKIPLFGAYTADEEGVPAARISLIEGGVLASLPMSRTPRRELLRSNGHGRSVPIYGGAQGQIGALFVSSRSGLPEGALRARALAEARSAAPDSAVYLVRRMVTEHTDDEANGPVWFVAGPGWGGSHAVGFGRWRPPARPLIVYRLQEGREPELVRGLAFPRPLESRQLADIVAVGVEPAVHNFFIAPEVAGMGELGTPASIVAPAVLLRNLEVVQDRRRTDAPLYPPPHLAGGRSACNDLALGGRPVRERLIARAVPPARGGNLRDGVYDFVSDDFYMAPGGKEGPSDLVRHRTIRIAGGRIETVNHKVAPEGVLERSNGSFTIAGNALRISITCPQPAAQVIPFSVTDAGLELHNHVGGRNVDVYVQRK
jgi:hypothetical protein